MSSNSDNGVIPSRDRQTDRQPEEMRESKCALSMPWDGQEFRGSGACVGPGRILGLLNVTCGIWWWWSFVQSYEFSVDFLNS